MLSHGEELYGQFVLCPAGQDVPAGWASATLGGWTLAAERLLPSVPIFDAEDVAIGWIVGHALADGKILRERWRLPIRIGDGVAFEDLLYRFGGRWVCAIVTPNFSRLYLDPSGSLATGR